MTTQTELATQLAIDFFGAREPGDLAEIDSLASSGCPAQLTEEIRTLIGPGIMNVMTQAFGDMATAEACIERMMVKYLSGWTRWNAQMVGILPADCFEKGPIWNAFRYLRPSALLSRTHPQLYEAHCDELLQRVVEFEETVAYTHKNREEKLARYLAPATAPELIGGFVEASLATPFNQLGVICYYQLFAQIFPAEAAAIWPDPPRESWPGQAEGEIQRLKEKYAQDRTL